MIHTCDELLFLCGCSAPWRNPLENKKLENKIDRCGNSMPLNHGLFLYLIITWVGIWAFTPAFSLNGEEGENNDSIFSLANYMNGPFGLEYSSLLVLKVCFYN